MNLHYSYWLKFFTNMESSVVKTVIPARSEDLAEVKGLSWALSIRNISSIRRAFEKVLPFQLLINSLFAETLEPYQLEYRKSQL